MLLNIQGYPSGLGLYLLIIQNKFGLYQHSLLYNVQGASANSEQRFVEVRVKKLRSTVIPLTCAQVLTFDVTRVSTVRLTS